MSTISIDSFFDELTKIAAEEFQGAAPTPQPNPNASADSMAAEGKNGDWRQAKKDDQTVPARKANNLFGLPLEVPKKGKRQYQDAGSSAAGSPDRSQAPVDGQSAANVSSGNQMSPATGPGGV
jgi:hypothetical protein